MRTSFSVLLCIICMLYCTALLVAASPFPKPTSYSFYATNFGEPTAIINITVYASLVSNQRRVDITDSPITSNNTLVSYLFYTNATGDVKLSFKVTYQDKSKTSVIRCQTNPTFDTLFSTVYFISDYVNRIGAKVLSPEPRITGKCLTLYSEVTAPQCDYFALPRDWTMVFTDHKVDATGTERAVVVLDEKNEKDLVFHWYKETTIASEIFDLPPECH